MEEEDNKKINTKMILMIFLVPTQCVPPIFILPAIYLL